MERKRHVAVIAPAWYPIPPAGYGGAELVVYLLVQSLRRQGVRVTLYGCEGSMPGTVAMAPAGCAADLGSVEMGARETAYMARVLNHLGQLEDVDVVHDNAGYGAWASTIATAFASAAPVVHTVHGPMTPQRVAAYRALGPRMNLVAISESQRMTAADLNWAGTVHNSVDLERLRVGRRDERDGYLLCLARVSEEKGQHLAVEAARRSRRRLVLAGKVGETGADQRYFRERVQPHIDGDRVVHIENVVGDEKTELIARASALVHAVEWPEPFGLAIVEAMASGTPCVGIGLGAVPELIINGVTGFLAAGVDGLVEGIGRIGEIDNERCAAVTRARFAPDVMARRYAEVYERVIAAREAAAVPTVLEIAGQVARTAPRATEVTPEVARPLPPAAGGHDGARYR
jgi:glycosyltransferase involved in cell wall biosynthesis